MEGVDRNVRNYYLVNRLRQDLSVKHIFINDFARSGVLPKVDTLNRAKATAYVPLVLATNSLPCSPLFGYSRVDSLPDASLMSVSVHLQF